MGDFISCAVGLLMVGYLFNMTLNNGKTLLKKYNKGKNNE
jgi:hypothetical protein